jgi:hypothetical protein
MKASRRLIIILLAHLVCIGGYYGFKHFNGDVLRTPSSPQNLVSSSSKPSTTQMPSATRVLLVENSKDLEETGLDCSKCEHSKIPPSNPQFYINIVVIISSHASHQSLSAVQEYSQDFQSVSWALIPSNSRDSRHWELPRIRKMSRRF